MTYRKQKNHSSTLDKIKTNKQLINSLYKSSSELDNVFRFEKVEIQQFIKKRTLTIANFEKGKEPMIHLLKVDFIKNYPIGKAFLLTDGKEMIAWVKFVTRVHYTDNGYSRYIYIKKMKAGYLLESDSFDFSTKFKPTDMELFASFLNVNIKKCGNLPQVSNITKTKGDQHGHIREQDKNRRNH